jgi:hypothetical protein
MLKIFADNSSWPQILKLYGNSSRCWVHPCTSGQLPGIKYGDELKFVNISTREEKIVRVIAVYEGSEYQHYKETHGEIQYNGFKFIKGVKVEEKK